MKLSRYNIISKIDNKHILFNSRTCALAELNEQGLNLLEDIKQGCFYDEKYDSDLVANMKRVGGIVSDDINELDQICYMNNVTKYSSKVLGLTIAPTMDCNYRCVYCFEEHVKCSMKKNVQEAIVQYVAKNINSLERLAIAWFGGEPMLEKSTIYNLSQRLISLCEEHSVLYSATMVSNGSLFSDVDVLSLKKSKIFTVQITIDGPKNIHDKRRIDISGKSSFDKIINTVNMLIENGINVRLRVNVDSANRDYVESLLGDLRNQITKYEELEITFGHVRPYTDECRCIENACISDVDFAETSLALCAKAIQFGFKKNRMMLYPHVRMVHCGAGMKNSIIIDPEGNLYKCSSCIGKKELSYGNILNGYDISSPHYLDWLKWSPFEYEACKECILLPQCMGGCQIMARRRSTSLKLEPVCEVMKYNIDSILSYYYNMLRK